MTGFVRTMEKAQPPDGNYGVYALDCEMCYTTEGCDALRVTVVSSDGKIVYETLIKSINPVLDYNTRIATVPSSFVAGPFGFQPEPLFAGDATDREAVAVKF